MHVTVPVRLRRDRVRLTHREGGVRARERGDLLLLEEGHLLAPQPKVVVLFEQPPNARPVRGHHDHSGSVTGGSFGPRGCKPLERPDVRTDAEHALACARLHRQRNRTPRKPSRSPSPAGTTNPSWPAVAARVRRAVECEVSEPGRMSYPSAGTDGFQPASGFSPRQTARAECAPTQCRPRAHLGSPCRVRQPARGGGSCVVVDTSGRPRGVQVRLALKALELRRDSARPAFTSSPAEIWSRSGIRRTWWTRSRLPN